MIAITEEMKEFLAGLNKEFMKDHKDNLEKLRTDLEESRYVELKNGEISKEKISVVIPAMYSDIKEIKSAIEPLIDFGKVHKIFKKYKVYYLIGFVATPTTLVWIWNYLLIPILKQINLHP